MQMISIHGGALAGSAAALAARRSGAELVRVYEKSQFPRQKVCGEFLSSGAMSVFRDLGLWESFQLLQPAPITRLALHFPARSCRFSLPETCWGTSRFALDTWLMQAVVRSGAEWVQATAPPPSGIAVLAHGRIGTAQKGNRTFGFKAHYHGPASESIELYFFDGCYVGVSPVEGGMINVCGLGPEGVLRRHGFDYDALCEQSPALRERLRSMERRMEWLSVGPLVYGNRFRAQAEHGRYPAGDALGFVDPFTGTGMFNALLSGCLAGRAAAANQPVTTYLKDCRRLLHRPFLVSSLFRAAVGCGAGERLAGYVPGSILYRLTRAHTG